MSGRGIALQGTFYEGHTGSVERTLQSKLDDVVSVRDFGAKGDGTTDDTAAFNAAITALGSGTGGTILVPTGSYVISTTITISAMAGLIIKGSGYGSILLWKGNASGPMFYLVGTRESTLRDLRLQPASASFPIASMIVQEQDPLVNGHTSTMNAYRHLQIPGLGVMTQGIYVKGDVTDANNDFGNFDQLFINGYTEAGILLQGANSFENRIVNCQLGGGAVAHYGVKAINGAGGESGHFAVYGGAFLGHTTADVYIQGRSALPYILDNLYSEGSVAYLNADGVSGSSTYIIIRGARFASSVVGASPIISIKNPGPVLIENSNLGTDFTKASTIQWTFAAGFSPPSFQIRNSRINGSLNTLAGIFTSTKPTLVSDLYWATSSTVSGRLDLVSVVSVAYVSGGATSLGAPDATIATSPVFKTVATDNVQFGWNNPTGAFSGQILRFQVKNGLGAPLNAATPFQGTKFRASAWTPPASGKNNTTTFFYDSVSDVFYEIGRSVDIAN